MLGVTEGKIGVWNWIGVERSVGVGRGVLGSVVAVGSDVGASGSSTEMVFVADGMVSAVATSVATSVTPGSAVCCGAAWYRSIPTQ